MKPFEGGRQVGRVRGGGRQKKERKKKGKREEERKTQRENEREKEKEIYMHIHTDNQAKLCWQANYQQLTKDKYNSSLY